MKYGAQTMKQQMKKIKIDDIEVLSIITSFFFEFLCFNIMPRIYKMICKIY